MNAWIFLQLKTLPRIGPAEQERAEGRRERAAESAIDDARRDRGDVRNQDRLF